MLATCGGTAWKMPGIRAQMRPEAPAALYRRRALRERLLSAVKRKRSTHAPGRSPATQCLQAWRLEVVYHGYRLECRVPLELL
jgi:hypothetical protein